jgi:hypothetical protein
MLVGCSGGPYGAACATGAICSLSTGTGVLCACPPTWLSTDPLTDPCRLPPSLLYTIPASAQGSAVKPGNVTAQFTFLNGGSVPLQYHTSNTNGTMNASAWGLGGGIPSNPPALTWWPPTTANSPGEVSPCSYQHVVLTVPTMGLAAGDGYEQAFTVVSNSISRLAPLSLRYDVQAPADPAFSLVLVRDSPVAGTTFELSLMPHDLEGLPIRNPLGTDVISGGVTLLDFSGQGEVPCAISLAGPTYQITCVLPQLKAGPALVSVAVSGAGVTNGTFKVTITCPPPFVANAASLCVCGPGAYYGSSGGAAPTCLACPRDTFKDSLPASLNFDACTPCGRVLAGSVTVGPGAASPEECLCPPGRFTTADNKTACARCAEGMRCDRPGLSLAEVELQQGYWRSGPLSTGVLACPNQNCAGGNGTHGYCEVRSPCSTGRGSSPPSSAAEGGVRNHVPCVSFPWR